MSYYIVELFDVGGNVVNISEVWGENIMDALERSVHQLAEPLKPGFDGHAEVQFYNTIVSVPVRSAVKKSIINNNFS